MGDVGDRLDLEVRMIFLKSRHGRGAEREGCILQLLQLWIGLVGTLKLALHAAGEVELNVGPVNANAVIGPHVNDDTLARQFLVRGRDIVPRRERGSENAEDVTTAKGQQEPQKGACEATCATCFHEQALV